MTNIDELYEESCRAYCTQCSNYRTITFMTHTVSGCACGLDPTQCLCNPLRQKLEQQKEARNVRND